MEPDEILRMLRDDARAMEARLAARLDELRDMQDVHREAIEKIELRHSTAYRVFVERITALETRGAPAHRANKAFWTMISAIIVALGQVAVLFYDFANRWFRGGNAAR